MWNDNTSSVMWKDFTSTYYPHKSLFFAYIPVFGPYLHLVFRKCSMRALVQRYVERKYRIMWKKNTSCSNYDKACCNNALQLVFFKQNDLLLSDTTNASCGKKIRDTWKKNTQTGLTGYIPRKPFYQTGLHTLSSPNAWKENTVSAYDFIFVKFAYTPYLIHRRKKKYCMRRVENCQIFSTKHIAFIVILCYNYIQ